MSYIAPSRIPDSKPKPTKSHADVDSDIAKFIASGGCIQVIERREPSPASKQSCSDIR